MHYAKHEMSWFKKNDRLDGMILCAMGTLSVVFSIDFT